MTSKNTKLPQYTSLLPILFVKDLQTEKEFYLKLGFEISYEDFSELPNFIAIKYGDCIEFGLEKRDEFHASKAGQVLVWQIGVDDINKVLKICQDSGFPIFQPLQTHNYKSFSNQDLIIKTPNGYRVIFES